MDTTSGITKDDLISFFAELEDRLGNKIENEIRATLLKKQFFTTKEFSDLIGLDHQTVKRYCTNNLLKATQEKNGGNWLIKVTELDRLIKEAEANHKANPPQTNQRDRNILDHQKKLKYQAKE